MLASGPSISRLSVEEVSPHGPASSQHQLSLEYAEIRLRTSCLIFVLLFAVEVSRDRAANSLSSSHPIFFTGGKLLYSLLPSCNARADQLPCPQQISSLQHIPLARLVIRKLLCVDVHLFKYLA